VLIDGGLHAQTIRPEGDIGSRAVGLCGIIADDAGVEWICLVIEHSFASGFTGIDACVAGGGVAIGAGELAGQPRAAIDFAILTRHAGLALWLMTSLAGRYLMRELGDQTFEQFDEPLAGHADRVDDGQGDESGNQAVFNGGGATLVTQKFPEHRFLAICTTHGVARRGCRYHNRILKIADTYVASEGCRA
jgi:hypothetical protein